LNRRPLVRAFLTSAALAAAIALGGCDTDGVNPSMRSLQPLSSRMLAEIEQKNMTKEAPILVRIFKEESELEVWKEDKNGRYALLKTYPICRWSGELGPKVKEGDRQAPEGFYSINPNLLNPNSSYYLAINMGFPNAYDRANGRTGNFLMIHGDCSSRGCYAMTDEQIAEIYALARESFFGGQKAFQIQAYPFKMTALNMAKHRNSPHLAFWKMLKQGHDHFEVSRAEPKVSVCEKRYVFDAQAPGGSGSLAFSPAAKCPTYEVDSDLLAAVREKDQRDEKEYAQHVSRGVATVAVRTGTDGGMNDVFLTAMKRQPEGVRRSAGLPGTIPEHARPPSEPTGDGSTGSVSGRSDSKVAAADPSSSGLFSNMFASGSGSSGRKEAPSTNEMLDRMSQWMGLKRSDPSAPPPAPASTNVAAPKTKPGTAKTAPTAPALAAATSAPAAGGAAGTSRPKPQAEPEAKGSASGSRAASAAKPEPAQQGSAAPANPAPQPAAPQATAPGGSVFDRFGAWR
jgi:murein L,D-transpeptidase YafK